MAGSGAKTTVNPPPECKAILLALQWDDDTMSSFCTSCSVKNDSVWRFLLSTTTDTFGEALRGWKSGSVVEKQQLRSLAHFHRVSDDPDKWFADFTFEAFIAFVRQEQVASGPAPGTPGTTGSSTAPSPAGPPGASPPAGAAGAVPSTAPSPGSVSTAATDDAFHATILQDYSLRPEDNLRCNRLFRLNRADVGVPNDAIRTWYDTQISLASTEPEDVTLWYARLCREADLVHVKLCPLDKFRPGFALFPSGTYTSVELLTMDERLQRKLLQPDTLPAKDPTVQLLSAGYFGTIHKRLGAFRFLHDLLQSAFAALEDRVLTVPTYDASSDVTSFATSLIQYQAHEEVARHRKITDYELSKQFLIGLRDANVAPVDHLLTELSRLGRDRPLPVEYTVHALARTVQPAPTLNGTAPPSFHAHRLHTYNGNGTVGSTDLSSLSGSTGRSRRSGPSGRTPARQPSAFYNPMPGAVCEACLRPGHKAATCLFLARHVALAEYVKTHPDEASAIHKLFIQRFGAGNRRNVAHALRLTGQTGSDQSVSIGDLMCAAEVDAILEADFWAAGQQE